MNEARLQLMPYTQPMMEMAVACSRSPTGALAAGKHGIGMLSIGGTSDEALQGARQELGRPRGGGAPRPARRPTAEVAHRHLRPCRGDARAGAGRHGVSAWTTSARYFTEVATFPIIPPDVARSGRIPDDAAGSPASARRTTASGISSGCGRARTAASARVLLLAHNWADWEATKRSYELMARYVHPHFQRQSNALRVASYDNAKAKHETAGAESAQAVMTEIEKYEKAKAKA